MLVLRPRLFAASAPSPVPGEAALSSKWGAAKRDDRAYVIDTCGRSNAGAATFVEMMTLFWHGHFATGAHKVRPAYKMWRQSETPPARMGLATLPI